MPGTASVVKNLCVRAGAGAGKTTNLTHRVLEYALEHKAREGRWPKVAVTTFTRKATQELRERLLRRCWLEYPDALEFVRSSHLLTISTLHGLMDYFLRSQGGLIGLSSQFTVAGPSESALLKRRVLRRVLKSESSSFGALLSEFKFNQILELLEGFRSAPPGASPWEPLTAAEQEAIALEKLKGLRDELERLTAGVIAANPPEEWLEFAQQLRQLVGAMDISEPWEKTWNRLRTLWPEVSKPRVKKDLSVEVKSLSDKFQRVRDDIAKILSSSYDPRYWQHLEENYSVFGHLIQEFDQELQQELLLHSKVLLEDLEFMSFRLTQSHPAAAQDFGARWDYWLIDEYQDTSPIQVKILKQWMQGRPFYVVGDPQQSIYLFRGARREVFFEMWEETAQSGKTLLLNKNYRTDPELLQFINWSTEAMSGFQSMEPKSPPVNKDWVAALMPATDAEEEWLQIKAQLLDLLENQKVRPDQILLLTRTRKDLETFAERLHRDQFPYMVTGGASFLGRRVIRDVLSVLRFLLNPWDDLNLIELLRSPWLGCSDVQLQDLARKKGSSLWAKLKTQKEAHALVLMDLLNRRAEKDLASLVFEFCQSRKVFATAGYMDSSGTREANLFKIFHYIEDHLKRPGANLLEIFSEAQSYDLDQDQPEADALSTLEPNRMRLMTYHAAKGLEADYVFLPHLHRVQNVDTWKSMTTHEVRGKWGFRTSFDDEEGTVAHPGELDWVQELASRQRQEEWRVFYVGLTRAKKKLFLSWQTGRALSEHAPASIYRNLKDPEDFKVFWADPMSEQEQAAWVSRAYTSEDAASAPALKPWVSLMASKEKTSVTKELGRRSPQSLKFLAKGLESSFRGQKIHRLFELLKLSDANLMTTFMNAWFEGELREVQAALEYVRHLKKPPLTEILDGGHAEWSFLVEKEGQVLEGQIDLWGRDSLGRLWIVDYKSGSSAHKAHAFAQLRLYSEALRRADQAKRAETVFVCALFPFESACFVEEISM